MRLGRGRRALVATTAVVVACSAVAAAAAGEDRSGPSRGDARGSGHRSGTTGFDLERAARGVPAEYESLLDGLGAVPQADRARVHTDLERLARAWAAAGGRDGFAFWERARWRHRRGDLTASGLRDYTVAYRELIEHGRSGVASQHVDSDIAHLVRDQLSRALEQRADGLDALAQLLSPTVRHSRKERAAIRADATQQLEASLRIAREATNLSQAALQVLGQPALDEDAFV